MLRPFFFHTARIAFVLFLLTFLHANAFAGTYTVKSGDNPAGIAKKAGVTINELLKANPGLDPRKLKVGQELNVPGAKDEAKKTSPEKASPKKTEAPKTSPSPETSESSSGSYVVKSGDNPGSIASKNGVSTKELLRANPGLDASKLRVGQKLVIPGKGQKENDDAAKEDAAAKEEAAAKKRVIEKAQEIASEKSAPAKPSPAKSAGSSSQKYKVVKGDSLGKIADKHKISLNDLRKANNNLDPRKLRVGQTLVIPGKDEPAPSEAPEAPEEAAPEEQAQTPPPSDAPAQPETPAQPLEPAQEKNQDKGPMDADAFFERGNELGKQNKFQQAIEAFDKAIKINPDRADYYASRGHAFYYMKLYTRAIEDYTLAIEHNAKFALAFSMRGLSRTRDNQFKQAVSDYDKAIELSPKEADYYKGRGWTYFHLKQFEPMCADYKKACELGDCEFLEVAKKSNLCTEGQ